jgi:outer membrane receptor protein involved in Fe transport
MRAGLPPGTVVVEAAPGSDDARRIESLSSRYTVALYHTWKLTDEITPRMGGPTFDLLDGFATDVRGLSPRHELSLQAGVFQKWIGARLTADWRSKSTTRSLSSAPSGTDRQLALSNYTTVNFSLFANPAERLGGMNAPGWIRGTRVALSVTNLFNTRPRVVDENGVTPIIYQPAYLNPLGRTLSVSLRKVF